ncbi:hypothetical protein H1C71_034883 [Ictidomys tridecemlineatus]|nr:hypothetical protein H1C71_034883 [Ictidomys tridecemlineatus]
MPSVRDGRGQEAGLGQESAGAEPGTIREVPISRFHRAQEYQISLPSASSAAWFAGGAVRAVPASRHSRWPLYRATCPRKCTQLTEKCLKGRPWSPEDLQRTPEGSLQEMQTLRHDDVCSESQQVWEAEAGKWKKQLPASSKQLSVEAGAVSMLTYLSEAKQACADDTGLTSWAHGPLGAERGASFTEVPVVTSEACSSANTSKAVRVSSLGSEPAAGIS